MLNIPRLLPLVSGKDSRGPKTYLQKKKENILPAHRTSSHRILRSRHTDLTPGRGMLFTQSWFLLRGRSPLFFIFSSVPTHAALPRHALCRPKCLLPTSLTSFAEREDFFCESCSSAALPRLVQKRLAGAASAHLPEFLI